MAGASGYGEACAEFLLPINAGIETTLGFIAPMLGSEGQWA